MTGTAAATSGLRAFARSRAAHIARTHGDQLDPPLLRRLVAPAIVCILAALLIWGLVRLGFGFERIWNGLDRLGFILHYMMPPDPGPRLVLYVKAMGETLAIALLGTLLGAILAFPLALLAAKNVVANRVVHFLSRRSLDVFRGIDTLIWALIWINVVGLGPFAGILAIAMADAGGFAKLFSEAIEASDRRPVEGVTASGGSGAHGVRFGILPEVFPVMISQVLYYIESNTRSATIIGIVGAGGIGLALSDVIRANEWQAVSFLIVMILVAVAVIDWISTRLRFVLIGRRAA
jgi:phosphonate transport system permease protein